MELVLSVIGAITGILSLAGIILIAGVWKGSVDADRQAWKNNFQSYPPGELWMMCKTMWDIYVVNILQDRPDLAERHSPWKLKPKARELIPDEFRQLLDTNPECNACKEDVANGWLVVKYIGLNHLTDFSKKKGISLQETIAVLSTYLEERQNHCKQEVI